MTPKLKTLIIFANIILMVKTQTTKVAIGAVATNGPKCAEIGAKILEKGGTAVDAAIAALFCEGVSIPNCMGLGGGFLMNIYIRDKKETKFLVSREVAPKQASKDMFGGDENLATRGGLAVAVPGELKGYWEAYQNYGGKVPWKDLVQPTIDLCKNGIPVTEYLEKVYVSQIDVINGDDLLKETFIDKSTNSPYKKGQLVYRPRLAKTLELIAESGPDVLYNGTLTKAFVKDIKDKGGIITEEDLAEYKPLWKDPIRIQLPSNQTLYTPPPPGSGAILGLIMNILSGFLDNSKPKSVTNWQRIIESYKFGYAKRTELGDPDFVNMTELISNFTSKDLADNLRKYIFDNKTFDDPGYYGANVTVPDDHGTANVCVYAPNGDAVSVTSTINMDFGAGFMSGSTGIILNDEMDDFSSPGFSNVYGVPPSQNNFIEPGKRPVSSMSPSIVVDGNGEVRLVIGGSGGTKIITSVVSAMVKNLWFNSNIKDAVADPRLHHQLFPMEILFENEFSKDMDFVNALGAIGHKCTIGNSTDGFNTLTSISRENGTLYAAYDPRRGGSEGYVYKGDGGGSSSGVSYPCFVCQIFITFLCMFIVI